MKANCKNCEKEFEYRPSQKNGIFCSNICQGEYSIKQRFTHNSIWSNRMGKFLKKLRGEKCETCGITEHNGKPLTFQIDHINGDRSNNTFENLKIVCPNCHTQCKTWGIGNISDDGKKRMLDGAVKGALSTHKKEVC